MATNDPLGIKSFLSNQATGQPLAPIDDDPNESALDDPRVTDFLNRISKAEGADYNTLVGGHKIDDLSRHPGTVGLVTDAGPSTAFGRYQITGTTDRSKLRKYRHLDYTPRNQDLRAVELLRQSGALDSLLAGDYQGAIKHAGKEWASLPGSTLPGRKNTSAFADLGTAASNDPTDPLGIRSFIESQQEADQAEPAGVPRDVGAQTSGVSPGVSELADVGRMANPAAKAADIAGGSAADKIRGITAKYLSMTEPETAAGAGAQAPAPLTVRDAAWHFGMTPDQAQRAMTRRQRRGLELAVAEDQQKKASGQLILPPTLAYQNEMRKRAGLPPLVFNVETNEAAVAPYFEPKGGGELPILTRSGEPLGKRGGFYLNDPTIAEQMEAPEDRDALVASNIQKFREFYRVNRRAPTPAEAMSLGMKPAARDQPTPEREQISVMHGIEDQRRIRSEQETELTTRIADDLEKKPFGSARRLLYTAASQTGPQVAGEIADLAGDFMHLLSKGPKAAGVPGAAGADLAFQDSVDFFKDVGAELTGAANVPTKTGTQAGVKSAFGMLGAAEKYTLLSPGRAPLWLVFGAEAALKNQDQPLDVLAPEVAKGVITGLALHYGPSAIRKALGKAPGVVGSFARKLPLTTEALTSATGFGTLAGFEKYRQGGSTGEVVGTALGAGAGAALLSARASFREAAPQVIASERAPEWMRETAGKATGKRPVIFQTEPTEAGEARFASVYVDPDSPSDFIAREVSAEEGSRLLGRDRPARIVPDAQFDRVFGRPDAQPTGEVAPMNRQIGTGENQGPTRSEAPPETPTAPERFSSMDEVFNHLDTLSGAEHSKYQQTLLSDPNYTQAHSNYISAPRAQTSQALSAETQAQLDFANKYFGAPEERPAVAPTRDTPRVPESSAAIEAQMDALVSARGSRRAVFLPPGSPVQEIPKGFKATETARGTIIYPASITRRELRKMIQSGEANSMLGHVNAESPNATRVVVAKSGVNRGGVKIGDELMSSYVEPGRETDAQKEMEAQFAPYQPTFDVGGAETEKEALQQRIGEKHGQSEVQTGMRTDAVADTGIVSPESATERRTAEARPTQTDRREPSKTSGETIVTAAIRSDDGTITTGKNHPQILLSQGKAVAKDRSGPEYGFVTSTGRFVSRAEAAKIAGVPNTIAAGQLYTEDLTAATKAQVGETVNRVSDGKPWVVKKSGSNKVELTKPGSSEVGFVVSHQEFSDWFSREPVAPFEEPKIPGAKKAPPSQAEIKSRVGRTIVEKLRKDLEDVKPEDYEELEREMPSKVGTASIPSNTASVVKPWAEAKIGDITGNETTGFREVIARKLARKSKAERIAQETGGIVSLDPSPTHKRGSKMKWAVVKPVSSAAEKSDTAPPKLTRRTARLQAEREGAKPTVATTSDKGLGETPSATTGKPEEISSDKWALHKAIKRLDHEVSFTINDLINEVERIAEDAADPDVAALSHAVSEYRRDLQEDFEEDGLRGDFEERENAFLNTISRVLPERLGPDQPSSIEDATLRMSSDKIFPKPAQTVRAAKQVTETLTTEAAAQRLQSWKDFAARIGKEENHSDEVVLFPFDRTGIISKPWKDAGYTVFSYDIVNGDDLLEDFPMRDIEAIQKGGGKIIGVVAMPPCTSFAVSGARWWEDQHDKPSLELLEKKYGPLASRFFDTPLEYAKALVHATQFMVEMANPSEFHVLENPVGRIAKVTGIPAEPTLTFDPHNYGDPYTKKTLLWGVFNPNLPLNNVAPTEGTMIAMQLRGDNEEDKLKRSETPEGFAYAFFMANHTSTLQPDLTVDDAAHQSAASPRNDLTDPSKAQRDVGNFQMGHVEDLAGLNVTVEIPEGGERKGVSKDGKAWSRTLLSHYGYIKRTVGADGEQVDMFLRPGTPLDYSGPVFIVNQTDDKGKLDEHKVMLGWQTESQARAAYLENYAPGWDRVGSIARFANPEEFKTWLATGDMHAPAVSPRQLTRRQARKEAESAVQIGEATQVDVGRASGDSGEVGTRVPAKRPEAADAEQQRDQAAEANARTGRQTEEATDATTETLGWKLEDWRRRLSSIKQARDVEGLQAVVDEMVAYRNENGLTPRLSRALAEYRSLLTAVRKLTPEQATSAETLGAAFDEEFAAMLDEGDDLGRAFDEEFAAMSEPVIKAPTRRQRRLQAQTSGVKAVVEPAVGEGGKLNTISLDKASGIAKQYGDLMDEVFALAPKLRTHVPNSVLELDVRDPQRAGLLESYKQFTPDPVAVAREREIHRQARVLKEQLNAAGYDVSIRGKLKQPSRPPVEATLDSVSNALTEFFPSATKSPEGAKFALAVAELDDATYAKVKPVLMAALELYRGQAPVEALKSLMRDLRNEKGWQLDQLGAMRPYVIRVVQDFAKSPQKAENVDEVSDVTTDQKTAVGDSRSGDEGLGTGDVSGTEGIEPTAPSLRRPSGSRTGSKGSIDVGGAGQGDAIGQQPAVTDSESINVEPPSRADSDIAGNGIRYPSDAERERELAGKHDYIAPPGSLVRQGSWRETARTNLDILELVKRLEAENRLATPDEQALLVRFTGWGASEIASNLFPGTQYGKPGERKIDPDYARSGWEELATRASELFTPEELDSALASTQFAHYTSEGIIRGIWDALTQFGFTGGAIVEPGMGIGLFASAAPREVMQHSRYTGIERGKLTAAIAKQVLQRQAVLEADFVKQKLPKNFFDLAIGNPPFARTMITDDPTYKKYRFLLHDYFFAKSIDSVRPGGLLVFVTSHGTMDKGDDKMRIYIDQRADLVGAIRLPQTAFKHNAGTEVVTDVLFLRKRLPDEVPSQVLVPPRGERWLGRADVTGPKKYGGDKTAPINEYFVNHPEMVLGKHAFTGTMRGADEYTVEPIEGDIEELFRAAIAKLPSAIYQNQAKTTETIKQTAERNWSPDTKKEGSLYLDKDGNLRRLEGGSGVMLRDVEPMSFAGERFLRSYVDLRNALKTAQYDQLNDGDWETSLAELNKQYDKFVKKHGRVTDFTQSERTFTDEDGIETTRVYRRYKNHKFLALDIESPLVEALEKVTEEGTIEKGAMLLRRTIKPPSEVVIRSLSDALAVSLDKIGTLNLAHVAELVAPVQKMTREEIVRELGDSIFEEPGGNWQMADQYLSGYVIDKLEQAEAAAKSDKRFERNVAALVKVQPKPLDAASIAVSLGASWIPQEVVSQFATEELKFPRDAITFDPLQTLWTVHGAQGPGVKSRRTASATWGTADRSPNELLDAALNGHSVKVYVELEKGKKQLDEEASAKANDVIKKMRDAFRSWLWTDADRTQKLVARYNRSFNNIAPREFVGDHLTLPGLSAFYTLHPHQKRTVWRQIQAGNTYLAHAVGAGKTLEMIVGAMEQRRLGLIRKPMFTVPNHMLKQFSSEFLEAYPMANILVADDTNFSKENRKRFVAQAALNDLDAVIITHSAFGLVRTKQETADIIVNELVEQLMAAIKELDENDRAQQRTIKELEARIENITRRFQGKAASESRDDVIDFEDLGVDFLYVDEAHLFRKLDFVTNRDKIKGIDPNGSRRALDMLIKTRWLDTQRPGRSLVMASGTPITNTLAELYTVQRYMDPAELERSGLSHFDAWAAMFGEAHPDYEMNAAGKYELVERFSRFVNMPELMKRVRQFMDVLTMKQLAKLVKVPTIKGGAAEVVVVPATAHTLQYLKEDLDARIETSRKWKPSFAEPFNPDPLINIITDGRLSATDMRYVVPTSEPDPGSKLNVVIDAIIERYFRDKDLGYYTEVGEEHKRSDDPKKGAGQIIFSYAGFGEQVAKTRGFDAKRWVVKRLTEAGIPANEIAFMSDYKTAVSKEQLFKDMRQGHKRLLFGSPMNMGTGVNAQKRLKTLHFIVPPWYPADIEQPDGRIVRQGNQNEEVEIRRYATKGTYDSTNWQMLARKARSIEQVLQGDDSVRTLEDITESSMYEMASALAAGDARAIQLAGLRREVERLSRLERAHWQEQGDLRGERKRAEREMESARRDAEKLSKAIGLVGGFVQADDFTVTVGKAEFKKRVEIGDALKGEWLRVLKNSRAEAIKSEKRMAVDMEAKALGKFPLTLHVNAISHGVQSYLSMKIGSLDRSVTSAGSYDAIANPDEYDSAGLAARIFNALNGLNKEFNDEEQQIAQAERSIKQIDAKLGQPFAEESDLYEKTAELNTLQREMAATAETEAAANAPAPDAETGDAEDNDDADPSMARGNNEPFAGLDARTPNFSAVGNRITINQATARLFARAYDLSPGQFGGIRLDRAEDVDGAVRSLRGLRRLGGKASARHLPPLGVTKLAELIEDRFARYGSVNIALPQRMQHEIGHEVFGSLVHPEDMEAITTDPIYPVVEEQLRLLGYTGGKKEIVNETIAFIAEGNFAAIGITEDQAVAFIIRVADAAIARGHELTEDTAKELSHHAQIAIKASIEKAVHPQANAPEVLSDRRNVRGVQGPRGTGPPRTLTRRQLRNANERAGIARAGDRAGTGSAGEQGQGADDVDKPSITSLFDDSTLRELIKSETTSPQLRDNARAELASRGGDESGAMTIGEAREIVRETRLAKSGVFEPSVDVTDGPAFALSSDPWEQLDPEELQERESDTFMAGIKKAVANEEQRTANLPPIIVEARRSIGASIDVAIKDFDPETARAHTNALAENARALTPEEVASAIVYKTHLNNAYQKAADALLDAQDKGDQGAEVESRIRLAKLSEDLLTYREMARRTGYEQGLALRMRAEMMKADFTLANVMTRALVANEGEALPPHIEKLLAELTKERDQAVEALKVYDEQAAQRAAEAELRRLKREERQALRRADRGKTRTTLDLEFAKLSQQFARAAARLSANPFFDPALYSLIGKMARNRVQAGVENVDELVDSIYQVVQDHVDEGTPRELRDAISGYGKGEEATPDEISQRLSKLKRLARDLSAVEDGVKAGRSLIDRKSAKTPREQKAQRRVKSALRDEGIDFTRTLTPEEQQARALVAMKARLRTRIEELRSILAGEAQKSEARDPAAISDDELRSLIAERDQLQLAIDAMDDDTRAPKVRIEQATKTVEKAKERAKTPRQKKALGDIADDMRETAKPEKNPEAAALKSLKTRLKNRRAELERKLANRDFSKKPKRSPIVLDEEGQRLQAEVERVGKKIDREIALLERAHKSKPIRALDYAVKLRRAVGLSSTFVIGKLSMFGLTRIALTTIEELIGAPMPYLPIIGKIARQAPREGYMSLRAETAALAEAFSRNMLHQGKRMLTQGAHDIDLLYGKKGHNEYFGPEWVEFFGRLHGMLKTPAKIVEFKRGMIKRLEYAARQGRDVSTPEELAIAGMGAYQDSLRSILLQDNALSSWFSESMRGWEKRGHPGVAAAGRMLFFVTKVPPNYVTESLNIVGGAVPATYKIVKWAIHNGLNELTQDEGGSQETQRLADSIIRGYKKQGIGFVMTAIGVLVALGLIKSIEIGGYYERGEKRKPSDVKAGHLRIKGYDVPVWAAHSPYLEPLQIGYTFTRAYQAAKQKGEEDHPLGVAAFKTSRGMISEIPFFEEPLRAATALEGYGGMRKYVGDTARGMLIPPDVQRFARVMDQPKPTSKFEKVKQMTGFAEITPVKRATPTIGANIQSGVPYLRNRLPVKTASAMGVNRTVSTPGIKEMDRLGMAPKSPRRFSNETNESYHARVVAEGEAALKLLETTIEQPWYKALKTTEEKKRVLQGAITSGRKSARVQLGFIPPAKEQTADIEE